MSLSYVKNSRAGNSVQYVVYRMQFIIKLLHMMECIVGNRVQNILHIDCMSHDIAWDVFISGCHHQRIEAE